MPSTASLPRRARKARAPAETLAGLARPNHAPPSQTQTKFRSQTGRLRLSARGFRHFAVHLILQRKGSAVSTPEAAGAGDGVLPDFLVLLVQSLRSASRGPKHVPGDISIVVELIIGYNTAEFLIARMAAVQQSGPAHFREIEVGHRAFGIAKERNGFSRPNILTKERDERFVIRTVLEKLPLNDLFEADGVEIQVGPDQQTQEDAGGERAAAGSLDSGGQQRTQNRGGGKDLRLFRLSSGWGPYRVLRSGSRWR